MQARFKETSSVTFNYNGTPQFKVFLPLKVGKDHLKVISAYDSRLVLMPTTKFSDIEIDNQTYGDLNSLIDDLKNVVFKLSGSLSDCCEENSNNISDVNDEVHALDGLIQDNSSSINTIEGKVQKKADKNEVIQNVSIEKQSIKFKNRNKDLLAELPSRSFVDQGSNISIDNEGRLVLSNKFGEILSKSNVSADQSPFDSFTYVEGTDLENFNPQQEFTLAKDENSKYHWVQKKSSKVNLSNTKVKFSDFDEYLNLGEPDYEERLFRSWGINISENNYILTPNENYKFTFWRLKYTESSLESNLFIEIEGNRFDYRPNTGNDGSSFQAGDIALNGWISQNEFGKLLSYSGSGDASLFKNWDIIESI